MANMDVCMCILHLCMFLSVFFQQFFSNLITHSVIFSTFEIKYVLVLLLCHITVFFLVIKFVL